MLIGIDGVALQFPHYRAGIYYYAKRVLEQLFSLDSTNEYRIYLSGSPRAERESIDSFIADYPNVHSCRSVIPQRFYSTVDRFQLPVNRLMGGKVDIYFGPGFRIFPRSLYRKSVVTIHDLRFLLQPETFSDPAAVNHFSKITKESLARADALIAVSKFTANQLINQCGISADRVKVIHNGVGEEFFTEVSQERVETFRVRHNIPARYILFVGFIEQKKNLLRLLEAFRICRQRNNFPGQLVLAGPQGDYTAKIIDYCQKHSLEESVNLLGEVAAEDLPTLYQGAEIFTFPSLNEGFGLPPLEAMASGTAVVASQTTALPEVLGKAACYVNPNDPESIAEGLYRLSEDSGTRTRMAEEGKSHAQQYRWSNAAASILELFNDLY